MVPSSQSLDVIVLGMLDGNLADLESEVLRTKAALLYGDHIRVLSHKVPMLLGGMAAKSRLLFQQVLASGGLAGDLAEAIAEDLEARGLARDDKNMQFILELLRGGDRNLAMHLPEVLADHLRHTDGVATDPQAFLRAAALPAVTNYLRHSQPADEAQAKRAVQELVELSESPFVDVEIGDVGEVATTEFEDIERTFSRTVAQAMDLLLDPARREHPLLSSTTRLSLQQIRRTGRLANADFTRANRVALAARVVAGIPAFPAAGVDELLDLRERVAPHLARFRAAVADFEDELNTDVLDEGFERAVDDIRERHIAPALEELRQTLDDAGATRALARATPTMAAGTLALGASLAIGAPELAGVSAVAAGAATATAKELLERHRQQNERKKNRLFLLFAAEQQLAR